MQIYIIDQISNYYIHVTWLSCSSGASLAGFSYFLVKSLPAVHHCVLHVPAVLMKNRHISVYSKETIINNLTVTGLTIILICEIKKKIMP
jgi:hypothetical protein